MTEITEKKLDALLSVLLDIVDRRLARRRIRLVRLYKNKKNFDEDVLTKFVALERLVKKVAEAKTL